LRETSWTLAAVEGAEPVGAATAVVAAAAAVAAHVAAATAVVAAAPAAVEKSHVEGGAIGLVAKVWAIQFRMASTQLKME